MPKQELITKSAEIIASGILGALAAYSFNLFHWHSTEKIRKIESICNALNRTTDKLEEVAISYWLSSPPENALEIAHLKQLEISIKSLLRTQTSLTTKLSEFSKNEKNEEHIENAKKLNDRLYDLSTGDDFESKTRKARPGKCNNIARICAEIRFNLTDLTI